MVEYLKEVAEAFDIGATAIGSLSNLERNLWKKEEFGFERVSGAPAQIGKYKSDAVLVELPPVTIPALS